MHEEYLVCRVHTSRARIADHTVKHLKVYAQSFLVFAMRAFRYDGCRVYFLPSNSQEEAGEPELGSMFYP